MASRIVAEPRSPLTYRDAGVDRRLAAAAKSRIRELVRSTFSEAVEGDFGGFGGCFSLAPSPTAQTLVASADGVGTKLKVAMMAGVHDTIGRDLVAHCANDILAQGALPLFFLDYLAFGKMDPDVVKAVVRGLAQECRQVGAALLGGETAEMPDMYAAGEYDLAGFIVGRCADSIVDGASIVAGDVLLGLASNGLHTNGYSLVRQILFERAKLEIDSVVPEWSRSVGEELLRPHRSYVAGLRPAIERGEILGLAHITGGGLIENLPRMLPAGCGAVLDPTSWEVPPVFRTLQEMGTVPAAEMWRTFNMGIGMVVAIRPSDATALGDELEAAGERPFFVGQVVAGDGVRLEPGPDDAPR